MPALYSHTTRANGTVLTATIYNGDHQNHIDNGVPAQLDDFSVNVGQMQSQVSPGGVGTESLPSNLAGELERLRYVIAQMKGTAFWYDTGTQSNALINVQIKTTTGTYTPSAGTRSVIVELLGGGGAGGGCAAPGASAVSLGGGGGAGGYSIARYTSGFSGVTVTIGAGGTGVSANTGNAGGSSSFGSLITCLGGAGGPKDGPSGTAFVSQFQAAGGGVSVTGNLLNIQGGPGYAGVTVHSSAGGGYGGNGANSVYGGGGVGIGGATGGSGGGATGYGAGGGGALALSSGSANAGGNGSQGLCIIHEFA